MGLRPRSDGSDSRAQAENRIVSLSSGEYQRSARCGSPLGKPLQPDQLDNLKPRLTRLITELIGKVEVGGGEPFGALPEVAILTVPQVPFDDFLEVGINEVTGR